VNHQFARENPQLRKALICASQGVQLELLQPILRALVTTRMAKVRDRQSILLKTTVSHESIRVLEGNKAGTVYQDLPAPKDPKAREANRVYQVVPVNEVLREIEDHLEIQVLREEAAEHPNHESLSLQSDLTLKKTFALRNFRNLMALPRLSTLG
jgi:hypothetical protein